MYKLNKYPFIGEMNINDHRLIVWRVWRKVYRLRLALPLSFGDQSMVDSFNTILE